MAPRNEDSRPPPLPRLYSRQSHVSKRSFLSHSSSFEADDERSASISPTSEDMDRHSDSESNHSPDPPSPPIRYAGEDTRRESRLT